MNRANLVSKILLILPTIWLFAACQNHTKVTNNGSSNIDSLNYDESQAQTTHSNTSLVESPDFVYAWNAAYGYRFCYPRKFKEIKDSSRNQASLLKLEKMISPDGKASLMFWTFNNDDNVTYESNNAEKAGKLRKYFQSLIDNQDPYTKDAQINYHKIDLPKKLVFEIIGEKGYKCFVWKTILSEWPVTGDYIFKSMLFEYDKPNPGAYEKLARALSNGFGEVME